MTKRIKIEGKKFGKLIVLKYEGNRNYLCKCDCGKEKIIKADHLLYGKTKSCGCLVKECRSRYTHNKSKTRLYRIWRNMRNRCYWKKHPQFYLWGGKGVIVCDEWKNNFLNFYNWAINNGYNETMTIDRIDGDGDYCPENCRWVSMKEQANNTKNVRFFEYNGERGTIWFFSKKYNVSEKLMRSRIQQGWTIKDAIETKKLNPMHFLKYVKAPLYLEERTGLSDENG